MIILAIPFILGALAFSIFRIQKRIEIYKWYKDQTKPNKHDWYDNP